MTKSQNQGTKESQDVSSAQFNEHVAQIPSTTGTACLPAKKTGSSSSSSSAQNTNKKTTGFTSEDFTQLAENENYRYFKNSKQIGHAVLARDKNGNKYALQYQLPPDSSADAPTVKQLTNIEEIVRYGMTRYKATDFEGHTWYAKRYDHAHVKFKEDDDAVSVDYAYFSEEEEPGKVPFWGSKNEVPRFRKDLSKALQEEFEAEAAEIKPATKGGYEMEVDANSVRARDITRVRKPDQNTLMGESARDAYEHFFSSMEDVLAPELIVILKRAFKARINTAPENQYRPEWLHAYGFSLTPMTDNPQRKDNLGAAGKWANTEMMVLERIAKWFALNSDNDTRITVKSLFDMLHDSELINKIHFEVCIETKTRFIRFIQDLDAFKKNPVFRKASDLAQATGISYAILHDEFPISQEIINGTSSSSRVMDATSASNSWAEEHPTLLNHSGDQDMGKPSTLDTYENSITKIFASSHYPDYEEPWLGTHIVNSSGSGMIIEHAGEKYVLTNAHVVENNIRIQVSLANMREKKFIALPVCISYQCDLALLRVSNPKFQKMAQPIEFGEMVKINDEVFTRGFPVGGDELSTTKGIVSRIEVGEYAQSGLDMLQVQVDSAINPGNSGGPVYCQNKVVGVAFQGIDGGQSLGYMIPIPIINHFIKEVFSGKPYRGFPILPVAMDTLENKYQRRAYGMSKSQTGVVISKPSPLSDASKKLKNGDVLLEIEGHKISNEGTIELPGIGKCIDMLHVTHMKFIGESVHLKVLRKSQSGKAEILNIDVVMDNVPLESELVPQSEFDKMPTYYINSGIVFVPVSRNYLNGPGSDLEDVFFIDSENGSYHISDIPKKYPNQQLIAINTILNCSATKGYERLTNKIIKKINGKEINNLHDLIEAMESNTNDVHLIEENKDKIIPVKNLSAIELAKILKSHKIPFDRSEDLRPQSPHDHISEHSDSDSSGASNEVNDTLELISNTKLQEASNMAMNKQETRNRHAIFSANQASSSSSSSNKKNKEEASLNPEPSYSSSSSRLLNKEAVDKSNAHKRRRIIDSDEENNLMDWVGKDGYLPGQRRYMAAVGAMENRYKNTSEDEDVIDFEHLTDDNESENESDYTPPPRKSAKTNSKRNVSSLNLHQPSQSGISGRHGLFNHKSKKEDASTLKQESKVKHVG